MLLPSSSLKHPSWERGRRAGTTSRRTLRLWRLLHQDQPTSKVAKALRFVSESLCSLYTYSPSHENSHFLPGLRIFLNHGFLFDCSQFWNWDCSSLSPVFNSPRNPTTFYKIAFMKKYIEINLRPDIQKLVCLYNTMVFIKQYILRICQVLG